MPGREAKTVLDQLRAALRPPGGGGLTDGQLLRQFASGRDGSAFAALVRRHGPMVLGVCRRVLGHAQDAEDAFQATFLVLARKARSLADPEAVGPWLYGVAYRTALEARAMSRRRRAREKQVHDMPHPAAPPEPPWRELVPVLDRELSRLPEKYRAAVVLCELEGRPRREAARQLGLAEGTLSWRLAAARKMLARRLARYGPPSAGAALAAALADGAAASVPAPLVSSTVRAAAAGITPAKVAALAEGVLKTMYVAKLKAVSWVFLVAVGVSAGAVGLTRQQAVAQTPAPAPQSLRDEVDALRLEVEALRKGLHATRERVKELEAGQKLARQDVQMKVKLDDEALKAQKVEQEKVLLKVRVDADKEKLDADQVRVRKVLAEKLVDEKVKLQKAEALAKYAQAANEYKVTVHVLDKVRVDALDQAEKALKHLREHPDDPKALAALERAIQQLKKQRTPGAE
jgi:RNA polymerase sigma factor (sigma-70 family)